MELPLTKNISSGREPADIAAYQRAGGYQAVRRCLKDLSPQQVQDEVTRSLLRGRGGAGFPTGKKWSFIPMGAQARRPKYFLINADEMEPGTFKDRLLLEGDPHQMVESAICASYAIEAEVCYIFLRREYVLAAHRLERAIAEAYAAGFLGTKIQGSTYSLEMHLHTSAGRYMCGEEFGLINALEGRRAIPRVKPPHSVITGLWGKPTVVNNVETIYCVPHIVNYGADWFKGLAKGHDGGTKIYGVSGRVKNPGAWEMPFGSTLREVLEGKAGGMQDGFSLRGVLPGGASTPFLLPEHLDVKLDFTAVEKAGGRLGTGTIIVLDDKTCPVGMLLNLERFFAKESCGWCTPCREGLPWIRNLLESIEAGTGTMHDLDLLDMHCRRILPGHTFCALAPGAIDPLVSALKYFRADFEKHVHEKRCPYRA